MSVMHASVLCGFLTQTFIMLQEDFRESLGHGFDVVWSLVGRKQHEQSDLSPAQLAYEKRPALRLSDVSCGAW